MPTVSKISFGDPSFKANNDLSERHRKRHLLSSVSSMTDEEIVEASVKNANEKTEKSTAARVLKQGPLMFIAATSLAYGALTKGRLSDKASSMVKSLCAASLVYALSKPVGAVTDAVINSTSKEGEEKQTDKHPALSLMANIAALAGVSALAISSGKKGCDFLAKSFAPTANSIKNSLSKGANKLNASSLGIKSDKVSKAAQKFGSKHPVLAPVIENAAFFFPSAAFLGGSLSLTNKIVTDRDKAAADNVNKLSLCREYAREALKN